jgi:membrane protein
VREFTEKAAALTGISIVFILIAASLVIATIEREINALWGISVRRPLRGGSPFICSASRWPGARRGQHFGDDVAFHADPGAKPLELSLADFVVKPLPLLLSTLALALLYAMAPNAKVPWRHAFAGALTAAYRLRSHETRVRHLCEERAYLRGSSTGRWPRCRCS